MRYKKRPLEVKAWQWKGGTKREDIPDWVLNSAVSLVYHDPSGTLTSLRVDTLEGSMQARLTDWIIKGVNGELYPCKHDVFEKTYEPIPKW